MNSSQMKSGVFSEELTKFLDQHLKQKLRTLYQQAVNWGGGLNSNDLGSFSEGRRLHYCVFELNIACLRVQHCLSSS